MKLSFHFYAILCNFNRYLSNLVKVQYSSDLKLPKVTVACNTVGANIHFRNKTFRHDLFKRHIAIGMRVNVKTEPFFHVAH